MRATPRRPSRVFRYLYYMYQCISSPFTRALFFRRVSLVFALTMPYSGPIYFEAVECSPTCFRCPPALASSSCLHSSLHEANASPSLVEAEAFEWTRVDSLTVGIDPLTGCRRLQPRNVSRLNDVHGPLLSGSRSFDLHSASAYTRAMTRRSDAGTTEMTPISRSWKSRSAGVAQPGKIRERSRSKVSSSSAVVSLSEASTHPDSLPVSYLPTHKRTGDHAFDTHNRIWSWVSGVDRGQQPLLDHSVPLPSDSNLQFPCDVGVDPDLYSPRTVASSLSAAEMSSPGSSRSSPLPVQRISHVHSASRAPDRLTQRSINDWQHMMDEPDSFLTSSPCPSSCSSSMGFASTLPREHSMPDETVYRSLLDRWSESEEWRIEEDQRNDEQMWDVNPEYNVDTYPRSATSSSNHSDVETHPINALPILLDQHGFSTLLSQSFALALADASLDENDSFQAFKRTAAADAEMEEDNVSHISYPAHLQDFDFMDQWSPPALRSSSSASSLDPFQLELFSPTTEQPDPAAIWSARRSPATSSESLEFFSTSPFVGWSSTSGTEAKPTLLTLGHMHKSTPFADIPLYQPQPIRPIPPIDIPVNPSDEFPERDY
ncbi:uncharacterized protein FOMMEDRAFT_139774 [Fomitiporia mediterranea MF3/22]|uniref:uncharacterized protein n=1 Tax=Fomitiporia mediterranea (strain MF3/22) TaxID=694068 RepID=UPI000440962E|nr:uncharacterized protein FOMMEDRAFT_139774 [Fomitiporia mediterranea MF3/22]EJD03514.1 hypothetical protein FOMMEDRAFT_139774 [Fomitiporia mediterranea MF3/22]